MQINGGVEMKKRFERQEGQGLVEYSLILVLISVVIVIVMTLMGTRISQMFARVMLEIDYPGEFSGPTVNVTSLAAHASSSCGPGGCDIHASATVGLDIGGSPSICVQFSASGGGSKLVCGANPSVTLPGNSSGDVEACVIGIRGHTLANGPVCDTTSY